MDLKTLGGKGWSDGNSGAASKDGVAGFMDDTNPAKIAGSIGGLLQMSRAKGSRQFLGDRAKEKELETSNSMSALETTGKTTKKNSTEKPQFAKRLSTNPSRNNPPGTSYTVQERPPNRMEIEHLEDELSDRLRTVTDLAGTELRSLDIGDMYQPHKDTMMLIKTRILADFAIDEDRYRLEPWFDPYVKCECLRKVSEEVASQLADMVSVSSISLGNVLRKLKVSYNSSYEQMKKSWCELHTKFVENEKELIQKRKQVDNMATDMEKHKKEVRIKVNEEIAELTDGFENERARDKEQITAADFHVEQMAGTLKSLNGIFKTMQTDGQAVTFADLTFKCNRLESEVENLTAQCQTLDRLKSTLKTSEERVIALERLLRHKTEEVSVLQSQLYKRDQSVAILMEREALRNSEIDKLQTMVSGNDGNNNDELEEPPTSVLCIRCKKSLDDLGNLREVLYGVKKEEGEHSKIQCENFRILLPHLRGRPPSSRPSAWLRFAMRNILVSKMKQDVTLLTIKGDVTKFPEYTYTWFERIAPATLSAGTKANSVALGNKHIKPVGIQFVSAVTLGQQADDDRWAMFDGVKKMAKKDPEAKLFWALLDETYGEDGMQFVLYCLSVVLSISGFQLWRQFGNCFKNDYCNSYSMSFEPSNLVNHNNPMMKNKHGHDHHHSHMAASRAPSRPVSRTNSRPTSPRSHHSHEKHTHHDPHHPTHPSLGVDIPPMGNKKIYLDMVSACNAVKIILVKSLQPQLQHAVDAMDALSEVPPAHEDPITLSPQTSPTDPVPRFEHNTSDEESEEPRHICLFTWLRIMLHRFSDDRSHREASVVSMFEVASVANLSSTATASIAANGGSDNIIASVEFQPFIGICKTLCPEISTGDMVSLFTQSYAMETKKVVTAKAFLKVADRKNFFSRCLRLSSLPLFSEHTPQRYMAGIFPDELLSEEANEDTMEAIHKAMGFTNTFAVRSQIGSLIHRKLAMFSFGFEQLLLDCPEKHRYMLQEAFDLVMESLNENSSSTLRHRKNPDGQPLNRSTKGGKPQLTLQETSSHSKKPNKHLYVDGMQPLLHYRRLLCTALLVKCLTQNPIIPGTLLTGMQHNTLPHLDLKFQKIDMVLSLMERAVQEDAPGEGRAVAFEKARLNLVVRKVQHVFRHFTYNLAPPVPRVVRFMMRPGYLRGTTAVRRRQIVVDPWWAQCAIAEIYTFKITHDTKAVKLGKPPIELAAATAAYFYHRFGLLDISERMIHDLYVCVQAYHYCLPRLRMFGAFSGCGSLEEPIASIMTTPEAQSLYLDLLLRVHKQIDAKATEDHFADMDADVAAETMRMQSTTANNGSGYAKVLGVFHIPTLFPSTEKNVLARNDKKDVWTAPTAVLDVAATKWATVGCLKGGGGSGGSSVVASLAASAPGEALSTVASAAGTVTDAMVYGQLSYKLRVDKDKRADVDDFLWLLMIHWAKCTAAYHKKSAVRAGFYERNKKQQAAKFSQQSSNAGAFSSIGLTDLCQSVYGAASQPVNGAPAITVDTQHVASLYVNHVVKRYERQTLEQMMRKSVTWDISSRIASSGAHQEELPLMKTGIVSSRFYHCTETACHILNGMSDEGILLLHDSADDVLPLRYNCHILKGASGVLSIEMARRSFQQFHGAINEMTDNLGKLSYDVKTEADRLVHTLRRNILQLEVTLDEPTVAVASDVSVDQVHAVWTALCSLYAVVHELSTIIGVPFPQDICGITRKLHLERSPVFSIQTTVSV